MATGEGGLASCRVRAGALPVDDQPHAVEEARAGVEEGEDSSLPVGAAAEQEQREAANSQRDEDVVDGDVEEARDGAERGIDWMACRRRAAPGGRYERSMATARAMTTRSPATESETRMRRRGITGGTRPGWFPRGRIRPKGRAGPRCGMRRHH